MFDLQAEINTWVVLSVALPGMTSDPNVALPAAGVGTLLAIGTAGLTVSPLLRLTSHNHSNFSDVQCQCMASPCHEHAVSMS